MCSRNGHHHLENTWIKYEKLIRNARNLTILIKKEAFMVVVVVIFFGNRFWFIIQVILERDCVSLVCTSMFWPKCRWA